MAMHRKTPITVQDKFRNALRAIKPIGGGYTSAQATTEMPLRRAHRSLLLRETIVQKLTQALDRRTVKVNTFQDLAKLITDTIEAEAEAIVERKDAILFHVLLTPEEAEAEAEAEHERRGDAICDAFCDPGR